MVEDMKVHYVGLLVSLASVVVCMVEWVTSLLV